MKPHTSPFRTLLLACAAGLVLGQSAIENEIAQCHAELEAKADQPTLRSVAHKSTDGGVQFRQTTDMVDQSGECDAIREAQLVPNENVEQVSVGSISLRAIPGTVRSMPIRTNPVGFSLEYGRLAPVVQDVPDPLILNLFANLDYLDAGPILHIGGNSATLVRLDTSAFPAIPGLSVNISQAELRNLNSFAAASRSNLTIGVPTLSRETGPSVEFIQDGVLPNIDPIRLLALELGNEPDHYQIESKCFRAGNYTFSDYLAEYQALETAVLPLLSATNISLQGPSIAGCNTFPEGLLPCWQMDLPEFASSTTNRTSQISMHRYGNSGCSTRTSVRTLLADPSDDNSTTSFTYLDTIGPQIASVNKVHVLSEGGAFSCGGNECLSGTFATTLWGLNNLFELLYRNTTRINYHTVLDAVYSPFHVFNGTDSMVEVGAVNGTLTDSDEQGLDQPTLRSAKPHHAHKRHQVTKRSEPVLHRLPGHVGLLQRRQVLDNETVMTIPAANAVDQTDAPVAAAPVLATTAMAATTTADLFVSGPVETVAATTPAGAATIGAVETVAGATTVAAGPAVGTTEAAVARPPAATTATNTETPVPSTAPDVSSAPTTEVETVVEATTAPARPTAATTDEAGTQAVTQAATTAAALPTAAATAPVVVPETVATTAAEVAATMAGTMAATDPLEPTSTIVAPQPTGNFTVTAPATTSTFVIRANPIFYAMWQLVEIIKDITDPFVYKPAVALSGCTVCDTVKVWGVAGTNNHTKVVVIHRDVDQLAPLLVTLVGPFTEPANITRLVSDGVLTSSAFLAGQSIGPDGKPQGEHVVETVQPSSGNIEFVVDQLSVAVIDLPIMTSP